MKYGKLKRMEEDLKSCPTVMLRVPISGSAASGSHGSSSKKDHKMPRRIIATVNPARSTTGSKSVLRNSESDSVSRYSVFSSRSQRRSGVSDGASTVRSRMSIRPGGNCCGYHVPGHVVLGVVIFSALTLWHHTNYFTPNSYLSPYITAMRDVTAETAQALYPPFENQNQAILQAMDMKSNADNSNYAEPQGMKVPHPNAAEMREFIRRAQSATQKDMIRMEILGESTGNSDLKGVNRKQLKKQEQRSLQDDTKDEEDSNVRDDETSSKKKSRKKLTDEDAEENEKSQGSSTEGKKKSSSRNKESREDEEEDNSTTGSPPRKNLRQGRSGKSAVDDKEEDEPPAVKKPKKEREDETTSSTSASAAAAAEEKVKEPPPKREEPEETPEVTPKAKPIKKDEESPEDELIPAHKVSDDPCMTMVTTIDPVKGIIQKKIPLVSCQK